MRLATSEWAGLGRVYSLFGFVRRCRGSMKGHGVLGQGNDIPRFSRRRNPDILAKRYAKDDLAYELAFSAPSMAVGGNSGAILVNNQNVVLCVASSGKQINKKWKLKRTHCMILGLKTNPGSEISRLTKNWEQTRDHFPRHRMVLWQAS